MTTILATILLHLVGLGPALDQATQWTGSREVGAAVTWAAVQTPMPLDRALPLWTAIGYVESKWHAKPRRWGFGCGWCQVLPVREWGRPTCGELENPLIAAEWGASILAAGLRRCHGQVKCALRRYNASDGREKYVRDVLRALRRLGRDWT